MLGRLPPRRLGLVEGGLTSARPGAAARADPARPAAARADHLPGRQAPDRGRPRDRPGLPGARVRRDDGVADERLRRDRVRGDPRHPRAGAAVVFISHRLHEVFEICDTITVLRDGEVRDTVDAATATEDDVIRLMVGRDLGVSSSAPPAELGDVLLRADDLLVGPARAQGVARGSRRRGARDRRPRRQRPHGVLEAIYGLRPRRGEVEVDGAREPGEPRARSRRARFVPEDRRSQGLAMAQSVRLNATMVLMGQRPLAAPTSRSASRRS